MTPRPILPVYSSALSNWARRLPISLGVFALISLALVAIAAGAAAAGATLHPPKKTPVALLSAVGPFALAAAAAQYALSFGWRWTDRHLLGSPATPSPSLLASLKTALLAGAVCGGVAAIAWAALTALGPRLAGKYGFAALPAGDLADRLAAGPPGAYLAILAVVGLLALPLALRVLVFLPVAGLDRLPAGEAWDLVLRTASGRALELARALTPQAAIIAALALAVSQVGGPGIASAVSDPAGLPAAPSGALTSLALTIVLGAVGLSTLAALQVAAARLFFGYLSEAEVGATHMVVADPEEEVGVAQTHSGAPTPPPASDDEPERMMVPAPSAPVQRAQESAPAAPQTAAPAAPAPRPAPRVDSSFLDNADSKAAQGEDPFATDSRREAPSRPAEAERPDDSPFA